MGWNSWNKFGCDIDEELIRETAEAMVTSGMAAAGYDYVHAKGLKLGIYSSAGTATCQGLPASLDHETTDAASFAEWGVDLLKYDNCNNEGRPAVQRYTAMADALAPSGREVPPPRT